MKITKKQSVKACDIVPEAVTTEPVAVAVVTTEPTAPECKYQSAIDSISCAIESLAEIAKDDPIAKDSIANLGVVLLDLKGAC